MRLPRSWIGLNAWFMSTFKTSSPFCVGYLCAQSGTDDTKWMTPLKVKQAVEYQVNQKFPVMMSGKAITDLRFLRLGTPLFNHDPRYLLGYRLHIITSGSTYEYELLLSLYDSETAQFIYKKSPTMSVAFAGSPILSHSIQKYRQFVIPNILPLVFASSSNSSYYYFRVMNFTTGSFIYEDTSSKTSTYIPHFVNGYDKTFFYLVTWSSTTLSIKKRNTSGSLLAEYTVSMPANISSNSFNCSLNTDTSGNFLIYYNSNMYYIKPTSSQYTSVSISPFTTLNTSIMPMVFYNSYFYLVGYHAISGYSTSGNGLSRYSPNGTSLGSIRSGKTGYENISRIVIHDNGSFVMVCTTPGASSSIAIYGNNITSFYSSGTSNTVTDYFGTQVINSSYNLDTYIDMCTCPNYIVFEYAVLDVRNSLIMSTLPVVTVRSGYSNVYTTKNMLLHKDWAPIDTTKSSI